MPSEIRSPNAITTPVDPDQHIQTIGWSDSPWRPQAPHRDWTSLVIHHSAANAGSVEEIHRIHIQRRDAGGNPWRGIGYHFVIGNGRGMDDGAIEPTFRWRQQLPGAHAGIAEYNRQGIGICLVGNFEQNPPTSAQLQSLKRLVAYLTDEYGIPDKQVIRHRDIKATLCPGKLFPLQEIFEASLSETSLRLSTHIPHSDGPPQ